MDYNRRQKKVKKVARVMALLLAAAMIASSGFYILMMFGGSRTASVFSGSAVYGANAELTDEQQFRLNALEEILQFIAENYKDEVDYDTLIEGMYSGMMDSLGDRWSEYYFSGDSSADALSVSLDGEFYGIGVSVADDGSGFRIMEVLSGGAAQDAGIKAGSYVVSVDGNDVSGLDLTQLTMKLRGKQNTEVKVGISAGGITKEYTLTRRKVSTSSLSYRMLENTAIGYIDLDSFTNTSGSDFKKARLALENQGMKGLIIDLRGNGGGYLDEAWDIADQLLDGGVIAYYTSQGEIVEKITASEKNVKKYPVVIITDENTASASEALTAALKDRKAATVVGEVTYGKGVAQNVTSVINGDSIKLSIIYFTGSSKESVDKVGIIPDHIVYSCGSYTAGQAAEILNSVVPLNENERFYKGEYGLNVLAAQQRLVYLGYDVTPNGIMDDATMSALRLVQRAAGSYSYGNLDNFTIKALNEQFNAMLGLDPTSSGRDIQLEKAIEVITEKIK